MVTEKMMVLERENVDLKKFNNELNSKLTLSENNLKNSLNEYSNLNYIYEELKSENSLLKTNYDEVVHQNKILYEELAEKNISIDKLNSQLHTMNSVLSKLTDVKDILNQHLSVNNKAGLNEVYK